MPCPFPGMDPLGHVVTVMELLSPANKAAGEDGLDAYLEKRADLLASGIHQPR